MPSRRQFLSIGVMTLGLGPVVAWVGWSSPAPDSEGRGRGFRVARSEKEWRATLTGEQYRVLRGHGTERPFSSPLNHEKRQGLFACAGCAHSLFSSTTKYDSGTGWPSFWAPLDRAVGTSIDRSFFMLRTEVHCADCGGHLGHVFPDGPEPTGLRYCMNGVAMTFVPS